MRERYEQSTRDANYREILRKKLILEKKKKNEGSEFARLRESVGLATTVKDIVSI